MKLGLDEMFVDFETYSEASLPKVGSVVYSKHESTKVLFMTYKIGSMPTKVWYPNTPFPDITYIKRFYALNVGFDHRIWVRPGSKCGIPHTPISDWCDLQAVANRYTYPNSLDDIGKVLNLDIKKDSQGTSLISIFSKPGLEHKRTPELFEKFVQYGITDTDSSVEALERMPFNALTETEQKLWELTYWQNERGIPIDLEAVDAIMKVVEGYQYSMGDVLDEITKSVITKPTQTKRIKQWCNNHGYPIENTTAATVLVEITKLEDLEKKGELTDDLEIIKTILEIRRDCGKSSVAKYTKMQEMYQDGRVHDFLQYYGAQATGRWAGRGVQPHNFVRAKVKDPDKLISAFKRFDVIESPVVVASELCRSMICAPEGSKLLVSDYSSIENRVLAWLAGDAATLQAFRMGSDQYIDMAAYLYQVDAVELKKACKAEDTKALDMRQMGKCIILGCGFGMGWKRFQATALIEWGMVISQAQAQEAVKAYRAKYKLVVKMWYKLAELAKKSVVNPGVTYKAHKCLIRTIIKDGTKWLRITLPSGRALMYNSPSIGDGKYGSELRCKRWVSHGWRNVALIPGLITENIVQATARDVLAHGLLMVERNMPEAPTLFSVHDEAISEIADSKINENTLPMFNRLLCTPATWMGDLPLAADGYISQRYKKG